MEPIPIAVASDCFEADNLTRHVQSNLCCRQFQAGFEAEKQNSRSRTDSGQLKKLVIFDLDGTLAASKSSLDVEMASLLRDLLDVVQVAIISGGAWLQFERQVLSNLPQNAMLDKLSILPTCGTKFYQFNGKWKKLYSEDFTVDENSRIVSSLNNAIAKAGYQVEKTWGDTIEDRGSQITYSALGQQAPLEQKEKWDADFAKRKKIKIILDTLIPEFSVHIGGATSIDVTKPGIDKAYGIRKLRDILSISIKEMIYVGDALFVGGNDYPAKQAGVISIPVRGPEETKRVIETVIACLGGDELELNQAAVSIVAQPSCRGI
jgi:phosphomannomutase